MSEADNRLYCTQGAGITEEYHSGLLARPLIQNGLRSPLVELDLCSPRGLRSSEFEASLRPYCLQLPAADSAVGGAFRLEACLR